MDLSLLVLQGKPQGKELPIRVSPFLIGRGPECHLRPDSDQVSRRHCALIIRGESVSIRDLGSTNGTIVDGERLLEPLTLSDGDIFQVGPLAFQVVIRQASVAERTAPAGVAAPAAGPPPGVKPAAPPSADDVVQWLVSDSKNEPPASGSGVYSGETVFNLELQEKNDAAPKPDPEKAPAGAPPTGSAGRAARTSGDKKSPPATTGGAAHAAEDMLRHFFERRPHK